MGFSWMSCKSNRASIGFENGLLICITHIGEEMLRTLLFYETGGWVKQLEIMLVIGRVLLAPCKRLVDFSNVNLSTP